MSEKLLSLNFFVGSHTREFLTHLERSPLPVKTCKCWPMLGSYGYEQWGFFSPFISVPHLLWHGATVYNGHLRRPVTLTLNANRLALELLIPDLMTQGFRGWESNNQPFFNLWRERSNQLRQRHSDWVSYGNIIIGLYIIL